MNTYDKGLMWFRRDLRSEDNAALYHALKACRQVWCVFVFDTDILDGLPRADRQGRWRCGDLVASKQVLSMRLCGTAGGCEGEIQAMGHFSRKDGHPGHPGEVPEAARS